MPFDNAGKFVWNFLCIWMLHKLICTNLFLKHSDRKHSLMIHLTMNVTLIHVFYLQKFKIFASYNPDLALSDFYLFTRMKVWLNFSLATSCFCCFILQDAGDWFPNIAVLISYNNRYIYTYICYQLIYIILLI